MKIWDYLLTEQDVIDISQTFLRDFLISYSIRGSLGFAPRLLKVINNKASCWEIFGESFGSEARKFGLFVALFFTLYKGTMKWMTRVRKKDDNWNPFVAGLVASLALLAEEPSFRVSITNYLAVRALQCVVNHYNARGLFPSFFDHTDSILFMLSCGQIVYSFVLRPDSLPPEYNAFIRKLSGFTPLVINNVLKNNRQLPIDYEKLMDYVCEFGISKPFKEYTLHPPVIPCCIIHPFSPSCLEQIWNMFSSTFQIAFAMYFPIHLIPVVLFKFKEVAKNPLKSVSHSIANTFRSSTFLATLCGLYQAIFCSERKLIDIGILKRDFKLFYWLTGVIAGSAIFIEKKARRTELTMYVLPKAAKIVYDLLLDHKLFVNFKNGELLLFSISMATIMHFYQKDPKSITPLLYKILGKFI